MIGVSSQIRVFVCAQPVDMRSGIDGLSTRVQCNCPGIPIIANARRLA